MSIPYKIPEIKQELGYAFKEVSDFCESSPSEAFFYQYANKWSAAQNLEHLTLSTCPLASALRLPKVTFRAFGKPNRDSYNYQKLIHLYQEKLKKSSVAPARYTPQGTQKRTHAELIADWKGCSKKLINRVEYWHETEVDKYLIPHPLLGRITIREMLFFTLYHTRHHLVFIRKSVSVFKP